MSNRVADRHDDVTILFSDIVGFTEMSAKLPPAQVVRNLNRVFSSLDVTASELGVEKIKTIGGVYLVAAGVPDHRDDHAEVIVEMAHRMLSQVKALNHELDYPIRTKGNPTRFNTHAPVVHVSHNIEKTLFVFTDCEPIRPRMRRTHLAFWKLEVFDFRSIM